MKFCPRAEVRGMHSSSYVSSWKCCKLQAVFSVHKGTHAVMEYGGRPCRKGVKGRYVAIFYPGRDAWPSLDLCVIKVPSLADEGSPRYQSSRRCHTCGAPRSNISSQTALCVKKATGPDISIVAGTASVRTGKQPSVSQPNWIGSRNGCYLIGTSCQVFPPMRYRRASSDAHFFASQIEHSVEIDEIVPFLCVCFRGFLRIRLTEATE